MLLRSGRAPDFKSAPYHAPLWLPVAPYRLFSAVRYAKWRGPFGQARRADGATKIIGFNANNVVDADVLLAWLGGSAGTWATIYDQSGNGGNFSQATVANQPAIALENLYNGILPVCFNGSNFNSTYAPYANQYFSLSVSLSNTASSVFFASRLPASFALNTIVDGQSSTGSSQVTFGTFGDGNQSNDNGLVGLAGFNGASGAFHTAAFSPHACDRINILGNTYGTNATTGWKLWADNTNDAFAEAGTGTAVTLNVGGTTGSGAAGLHDCFACIVFNSELSAANVAILTKTIRDTFEPEAYEPPNLIVATGASTAMGYAATHLNHGMWIALKEGLVRQPCKMYNFAIWGQSIDKVYALFSQVEGAAISALTSYRTIFYIGAGAAGNYMGAQYSGSAGTLASDTWTNYTKKIIDAARSANPAVKIMAATEDWGSSTDTTFQGVITSYNSLLAAAVGTEIDVLIDLQSIANDPSNLTPDGDHYTDLTNRTLYAPMWADGINRALALF